MNPLRMGAARLAVFIESAGVVPLVQGSTYRDNFAALLDQYLRLEMELRWYARVEGRRRIREQGLKAAAIRLIPVPAPVCDLSRLGPDQRRRVRLEYRRKLRRHSPATPLCPKCRIESGMPKRSWPSRAMAEQARARQNDPRLHVYPCPVQAGYWHLGHRR